MFPRDRHDQANVVKHVEISTRSSSNSRHVSILQGKHQLGSSILPQPSLSVQPACVSRARAAMPIDVEFEDVTDKKGKEGKVAEEVVELIEKHFLVPEEIVQGVKVRAIWKLGKPWFCLADLCAALGKKGTAAAFG